MKDEQGVIEKVKVFYEKYPYPPSQNNSKFYEKILEMSGSLEGKDVLDAGCGTGTLSRLIAAKAKSVTGIDISEASIAIAKQLGKRLVNATFLVENLATWKPNKRFDTIFCIGVLHHTANPYDNFTRLCALLKGGGNIILGLYSNDNVFYMALQAAVRFLPEQTRVSLLKKLLRRDEVVIADTYAHPHKTFHTIEEVGGWFLKNKLSERKVQKMRGFFLISGQLTD